MSHGLSPTPGGNSQKESIPKKADYLAGLEWSQGLSQKPGAATAFPAGCLWAACPGTPGTGDIVPALSALALLAIVTGAHQAPGLSTRCIFLTLWPSEKTSKTREMCFFALFGV